MSESPASRQRELVMWRDCPDDHRNPRCFASLTIEGHKCDGPMDCAHLIPAQRLKNMILGLGQNSRMRGVPLYGADFNEVVYHPDVAVAMCRAGHHSWDLMGKRCRRDQLPERVEVFARQWWITHLLDEMYGRVEAAAA